MLPHEGVESWAAVDSLSTEIAKIAITRERLYEVYRATQASIRPPRRKYLIRFPDRHHREHREPASYTATEVKNGFGRILEKAIGGETVVITKHDSPKAVLISVDQFNALKHAPEFELNTLSGEFDALLARMQSTEARIAMKAAFRSSPQQRPSSSPSGPQAWLVQVGHPVSMFSPGQTAPAKAALAALPCCSMELNISIQTRRPGAFCCDVPMTQEDANSAAWYEGTRLLERAITERLNFAFETSLAAQSQLCWRERWICITHLVCWPQYP